MIAKGEMASQPSSRIFILDGLRGVAALAVVFNHWKHFSFNGVDPGTGYDRTISPGYHLLWPLYEYGWLAVDLFFTLSGFVFFALYGSKIRLATITAGRFFWLRFSRLYPLHLLTLCTVAALQFSYYRSFGEFFIYDRNDAVHFVANLALVTWAVPGPSFNAPVWSVCIEVLLYCAFYIYCRNVDPDSSWPIIAMAGFGILLQAVGVIDIGRGVLSFFLGALAYNAYSSPKLEPLRSRCGIMLTVVWATTLIVTYFGARPAAGALGILVRPEIARSLAALVGRAAMVVLVFPLTIFALASAEGASKQSFRFVEPLGQASYAMYLLHFPLQLACMYVARTWGLPLSVFQSAIVLGGFLIFLATLSWFSYHLFERPAQDALRKWRFAPGPVRTTVS